MSLTKHCHDCPASKRKCDRLEMMSMTSSGCSCRPVMARPSAHLHFCFFCLCLCKFRDNFTNRPQAGWGLRLCCPDPEGLVPATPQSTVQLYCTYHCSCHSSENGLCQTCPSHTMLPYFQDMPSLSGGIPGPHGTLSVPK